MTALTSRLTDVQKFGRNAAVGTTAEPIADDGVTLANYQQAAVTTAAMVVSGSDNDNGAGTTGALTIRIHGLNAAWEYQFEDLTLNGTTEVATAKQYIRVWRMQVLTAGSGGVNAGAIDFLDATGADVMARITAGWNQTLMAMFSVPVDHQARVTRVAGSLEASPAAGNTIALWAQDAKGGGARQVKLVNNVYGQGTSHFETNFDIDLQVPGGYDLWMEADASTGSQIVNGQFDLRVYS